MPKPTTHYFELGQAIQALYWRHYTEVLARYPHHTQEDDVRPALLALPGNALVGYLIAMSSIETTFTQRAWWEAHTPLRSEEEIRQMLGHYDKGIRHGFFVLFVSRFEWVVRNILVLLDPAACRGGLAEFKGVYDALLARLDLRELTTVLDVARHLRNSIHNNGVYCHYSGKDSEIYLYRGQRLRFVQGASIDAATELSFQVMEDLILAARQIVDAPKVASLPRAPFTLTNGRIVDPRMTE